MVNKSITHKFFYNLREGSKDIGL